MEKATRDDARMVAFKAEVVESSPPKIINATPMEGMKFWAALAIAVSWYCPRNCQDLPDSG